VLILTKGFDICLAGYDSQDWQKRTQELMGVSLLDKEHIDKRRVLFSGANEIEFDDQGRCVVPKSLLEFMGFESKKVKIVGVGDHFEIWEETKWNNYLNNVDM
jgi:MraZ protein